MKIIDKFLTPSKYSRPGLKIDKVMGFVVHWTATPMQEPLGVWHYYESDEAAQEHYGSSHYCIGFEGEVYRFIPDDEAAMAVGSSAIDPVSGLIYTDAARMLFPKYCTPTTSPNRVTLNVEVCVLNTAGEMSEKALNSLMWLATDKCTEFTLPWERLLRHYDIVGWKDCPRWFVNHPSKWLEFKSRVFPRSPSAVENERSGR